MGQNSPESLSQPANKGRINEIKDFTIYCAFNNGEHGIIDFKLLFKKWEINENSFNYLITKDVIFRG